jgi:riboflavin-specific deaminase-like protein
VHFRRLHPEPGELTPAEAAAALRADAQPPPERPYLAINMVATADGRITIGGRSGPIGNQHDRRLFHELRGQADAVLVGAGTARNEHYGRMIRDPERREGRAAAGLDPEPLAIITSARLALDPDEVPLLAEPESRVIVITGADGEIENARASIEYVRTQKDEDAGVVPLTAALRDLRKRGIETVLCEGGPILNATLFQEDLVDELWLVVASKLGGGTGPTSVSGPELDPPRQLELISALEGGGDLFLRYRVTR